MKSCFKCLVTKPLTEFYAHAGMTDGHLGKCKECAKQDVRARYAATRGQRAAYERERARDPRRRALRIQYLRELRRREPEKARAWAAVSRAVRSGKLLRKPCEVCGAEEVQAHHADYSRPLDVNWLCFRHHREGHGQTVGGAF